MVQGLVKAFWDLGLVCLVLRGAISTAGDRAASFLQVGVVIGTFGCLRKQDAALQSMREGSRFAQHTAPVRMHSYWTE